MSLTSMTFLFFFIGVASLYYLSPKKYQWVILLFASYVFFAYANVGLVIYLLITTLTTWYGCLNLKELEKKKKKNRVTYIALLNFGILALLKYNNLFGPGLNLLIPIGISFYTFQSMGYTYDVYRNRMPAERNVFKCALFVAYFPQIIQGPISRYKDLNPQLTQGHSFSFDHFKNGVQLVLWGYFKKLVIADRAAVVVSAVYGDYLSYSGAMIILAVLLYCIQIYTDFSGGIDIIRGLSQILSIQLVENFKRPYYATSLADYWRRWHISLGTWMKDYFFYPVSLSKGFLKFNKKVRKKIPGMVGKILPTSLITFFLFFIIGIWHGAEFKYIAFGIYNGIIITASLLLDPVYKKLLSKLKIKSESKWFNAFRIIRTTVIVFVGRYLTRGISFMAAGSMMKRSLFSLGNWAMFKAQIMTLSLSKLDYSIIFFGYLFIMILGYFEEKGKDVRATLEKQNGFIQFFALFTLMAVLTVFGIYREGYITSEFIYKQF